MRISDWSSDVCSSDLDELLGEAGIVGGAQRREPVFEMRERRFGIGVGPDTIPRRKLCGRRRGIENAAARQSGQPVEIGRASWRERVCPYVEISVVAVSLKQNNK